MREQLYSRFAEAGGKLTVMSALNPMLWLCAIISVPGIYFISQDSDFPLYVALILLSPIVVAIAGFFFLLFQYLMELFYHHNVDQKHNQLTIHYHHKLRSH